MKVLLVCAGGMSTSILMKKLEKYAEEQGIDFEVAAVGETAYRDVCHNYDCILLGPQIGYMKDEIKEGSDNMPLDVIAPQDYGIGNCENIFAQINALLGK